MGIGNILNSTGTTVSITGGTVTAKGDFGSRTLYSPYVGDTLKSRNSFKSYDIAAEKIVISGGQIFAYNFNKQPVNSSGEVVNQVFVNCKKWR